MEINGFGDLTFKEFGTSYTGFGILGGDNVDIDESIEPVTKAIGIEPVGITIRQPRQIQEAASLDWSLRGDLQVDTLL